MSAPKQIVLERLATQVEYIEHLDKKLQEEKRGWNRCHKLGWLDMCPRHLVLYRLCPEKEETPPDLIMRMIEGKRQEELIRSELVNAGVQVIPTKGQERFDKELRLRGEADDILQGIIDQPIVVDYKSASSAMFRMIRRAENLLDLLEFKQTWIRNYPWQMEAYHHLYNLDYGQLIFKNKETGHKHIIDTERDSHFIDTIKNGLVYINQCVEKEDPPSAEWKDECRSCGFSSYCFPDSIPTGDRLFVVDDPEVIAMVERHQEIKPVRDEYNALDSQIKDALGDAPARVGDYLYTVTEYNTTSYDVPKDIKEQYRTTAKRTRRGIKPLIKAL